MCFSFKEKLVDNCWFGQINKNKNREKKHLKRHKYILNSSMYIAIWPDDLLRFKENKSYLTINKKETFFDLNIFLLYIYLCLHDIVKKNIIFASFFYLTHF